jgi:hypothetical protein
MLKNEAEGGTNRVSGKCRRNGLRATKSSARKAGGRGSKRGVFRQPFFAGGQPGGSWRKTGLEGGFYEGKPSARIAGGSWRKDAGDPPFRQSATT